MRQVYIVEMFVFKRPEAYSEVNCMGISGVEESLRKRFLSEAKMLEPGYVSAESINQIIDPQALTEAAFLASVKTVMRDIKPDIIVPIPTMGVPFGTEMSRLLNVKMATSRKGEDIPGSWKNAITFKQETESFTTGKPSIITINGVKPGQKALLVDDFLGTGKTLGNAIEELDKEGIETEVAIYCAKFFQSGIRTLLDLGKKPIYVLGIDMTHDGKLSLIRPTVWDSIRHCYYDDIVIPGERPTAA